MDFEVFGPYEIPFVVNNGVKRIEKYHVKEFWTNSELSQFCDKHGCYVFALRSGGGFKPWYVGKTNTGMKKECFSSHKLDIYNGVVYKCDKGTPVMFFITYPGGKMKASQRIVGELEKDLIASAVAKHPDIAQVKDTKGPRYNIAGITEPTPGRDKKTVAILKKC